METLEHYRELYNEAKEQEKAHAAYAGTEYIWIYYKWHELNGLYPDGNRIKAVKAFNQCDKPLQDVLLKELEKVYIHFQKEVERSRGK